MTNTNLPPESDHAELLDGILSRASTDLTFREALLSDPKAAIYDTFGIRVPDQYRIRFLERDSDFDTVVVLPDYVDPDGELSDDDLDVVHGGDSGGGGDCGW